MYISIYIYVCIYIGVMAKTKHAEHNVSRVSRVQTLGANESLKERNRSRRKDSLQQTHYNKTHYSISASSWSNTLSLCERCMWQYHRVLSQCHCVNDSCHCVNDCVNDCAKEWLCERMTVWKNDCVKDSCHCVNDSCHHITESCHSVPRNIPQRVRD